MASRIGDAAKHRKVKARSGKKENVSGSRLKGCCADVRVLAKMSALGQWLDEEEQDEYQVAPTF